MSNEVILEMKNISKSFMGVVALDNMQLTVKKGTVHALMGENGAGKSTLMKIIFGIYTKDEGTIILDGQEITATTIKQMLAMGVSMIHQELNSLDYMTVAENVFINREPRLGKTGVVDFKEMKKQTKSFFDDLGIPVDVSCIVGNLSVAQKQLIEIVRAVSFGAKLIIMDEPTSAITEKECQQLFEIIYRLKERGIAFIYITHKMDEVFEVSDEITVMRDGKYVKTLNTKETSHNELVKYMVGRDITEIYPKENVQLGDVAIEIKNLNVEGLLHDISFQAKKGEILGVAGLMGAGRTEIMEAIFGLRRRNSGEIYLYGKQIKIKKPRDAIKNRIAFLTEDRKKNGCFLPLTVYYNALMLTWKERFGVIKDRQSKNNCKQLMEKYNVKTPSINQTINKLSGGNQQKVLLARWLNLDPDIIILDEPTRGVDVGSKHEIYNDMMSLVKRGKTLIMISSEMPEILGMSDRIMVIHDGSITGVLDREDATQEKILNYAAGLCNDFA